MDGKAWKAYTEPVLFLENGIVYFRGTDEAGNISETVTYEVTNISQVALDKPIATADITSPTNTAVHVSAVFNENAVTREYSLDSTEWFAYTGSIEFTENGFIFFRSTDGEGNASEITIFQVKNIDKIAPAKPTASADVTDPTSGAVRVSAVFSEDSAAREYSLDGKAWKAYTEPVLFLENGAVYFRGTDEAGNISETVTYEVTNISQVALDKPIATADITSPTNTAVHVSAVFNENAVTREYSLDSTEWFAYTGSIEFTENGFIFFRSTDGEGNVSEITIFQVKNIDKVAPVAPTASADVTAATNGDVLVSAIFSEDSAVKEYSLDGENWQAYTEPVLFTENGSVFFRGTDAAGNVSEVTALEIGNIDKVAPEAPAATANMANGNMLVTAVFSDDSVLKEYSLDGQKWLAYTAAVVLSANGSVFFRGTDAAGNVSEVTTCTVDDIVVPDNRPDDGRNDYLWDKKAGWNTANIHVSNTITGNCELSLDEPGSINLDDMHNLFGNDGTNVDSGDVAKIDVESVAKLTFTIDSTAAGTFYVYEDGKDKKGNRKQLQVGKVTVKAGQIATLKDVCLVPDGSYYVAMVAKNVKKAGAEGLYNVNVTSCTFFVDADNGGNNAANKNRAVSVERGTTSIVLDNELMAGNAAFDNFVGFNDSIDYAKLALASSGYLSFDLKATGAAKFTIWKQDASGKLSKVGGVTTLNAKNGYSATSKAQFLDTSKYIYYVSMESTDAAKGGSAYYNVELNDNSIFFDCADHDLINGFVYDKKKNLNKHLNEFQSNVLSASGETEIFLDSNEIMEDGYSNFVGYDDKADYAKLRLSTAGDVTFMIDTTGAGTFTVYQNNAAKKKLVVIAKTEIKVDAGAVMLFDLDAGDYFISMAAKKTAANDKGCVYYNVTAKFESSVADARLEAPLAMPETDSFGFDRFGADALADASVSSIAEPDGKSAWQSIATLA